MKRSIKLRQFYWPVWVPWFISELLMLNQPPAGAVFAVPAANIHYPPPCRYKPFLSMAVQCYRDRLYGWLFPAWHRWWMAAAVTINMFPSHLKEPHARVARVAHGLFPAVCPPFSLFAGHGLRWCLSKLHSFCIHGFIVINSDTSIRVEITLFIYLLYVTFGQKTWPRQTDKQKTLRCLHMISACWMLSHSFSMDWGATGNDVATHHWLASWSHNKVAFTINPLCCENRD